MRGTAVSRKPRIERAIVGTVPAHGGQPAVDVESYVLDAGAGPVVTVWTYGATLVEVLVPDRDGRAANVCLRLPDLAAYLDRDRNPYVGATVGRYCRCVAGGEFDLDGVRHVLDRNQGRHHVHGGSAGVDRRVWSAQAARDGEATALRLSLTSPDGDQGYPGELSVVTTHRVEPSGALVIEHTARTTAPTIVGLTNHAFWNLAGGGTIDDHELRLDAVEAVRFDEEVIPLPGPPLPVRGTELDFTTARRLGGTRVDNCYVLAGPSEVAELSHPGTGRVMSVWTDQPAVGVYTGDFFTRRPRGGICLETGALPDAPNRPEFPSARLDPGQTYRHRTVHHFGCR
jgi:aldose 1-epimerase